MKTIFYKILIPVVSILFLCSMDQAVQKKYQLAEGISAKLPSDFLPMSDEDIATKYPSTKKPLAMFTTMDRMVDFGLNVTKSNWAGRDLNLLKDIYKSTLFTLYGEVNILTEEIRAVNKQNFIILEFTSKADHTRKYTFLQYGIFNHKVYIFNFTCAERDKEKWRPVAQDIMSSIKVKPGKLKAIQYDPNGETPGKGKSPQEVLKHQKQSKLQNKTTSK